MRTSRRPRRLPQQQCRRQLPDLTRPHHQCRMRTNPPPDLATPNCPRSWLPLWLFGGCERVGLVSCRLRCPRRCCTGALLSEELAVCWRLQASSSSQLFGGCPLLRLIRRVVWLLSLGSCLSRLSALVLDVGLLPRLPRLPLVSSASCLEPFVLLAVLPCSVEQYSRVYAYDDRGLVRDWVTVVRTVGGYHMLSDVLTTCFGWWLPHAFRRALPHCFLE
jgi:hypothetical protein